MTSLSRAYKSMLPIVVLILLSIVNGSGVFAGDLPDASEARTFVVKLADRTIHSLTEKDINKVERRNRFRSILLKYFAFKDIGKWVLGRYWRRASEAQRQEFLELFEELLVVVYADRFSKYAGLRLDVGRSEIRGANDILVHSILKRPKELKPITVIWRIRKSRETFKVLDLMVEGLSMGLTQQKEFTSVIRKNGGKVQGLIDELKKRITVNS